MQDLTFLEVESLIVHELPKKGSADGILSDSASPLPDLVRKFFEERIKNALGYTGIPIRFIDGHESTVPPSILALLSNSKAPFVALSQEIAKRLFALQNKVHSEGLLCVAQCKLQKTRAVALIKLELEEGVRAELRGSEGNLHFEIQVIDDLMLTQNTRVFKLALFEASKPKALNGIAGRACDNQRQRFQLLAEYFLGDFLGCELTDQPDITTQKFLNVAESFFNASVPDPVRQASYTGALLSELNNNRTVVMPREFAATNLEQGDRAPFLAAMRAAEVPVATFAKDTGLIGTRIVKTRFEFEEGIFVLAPPETLDASVKVTKGKQGKTHLVVDARLKKLRGAR